MKKKRLLQGLDADETKLLEQFKKRMGKAVVEMKKRRDEVRGLIAEYEAIADDAEEAIELFEKGLDIISQNI